MKSKMFSHSVTIRQLSGLAILISSTLAHAGPFELLVTQSPPGPANQDPATWQGVLQFSVSASGGVLVAEAGIDKAAVVDPSALAFRPISSEVFVGNRHGNSNPSSISRFLYNPATHALTPNGAITDNGLYGVHQITFNPVTGEMFAANYDNGVSRFMFDTNGNVLANGTIGSGPTRGVAVSPDGLRLYVTGGHNALPIRQFDLTTGTELESVSVPTGVGGLHYLEFHNGQLYVAAISDDCLYRYTIDGGDNLTLKDTFAMNDPVGIAFSPDGQEMFVSGHRTSDLIMRFQYASASDQWTETSTYDASSSLGGVLVIPNAPLLSVFRTTTNTVAVSWPSPSTGWNLQQNTNSVSSLRWSNATSGIQDDGATKTLIVNPLTGSRFYRLHKP